MSNVQADFEYCMQSYRRGIEISSTQGLFTLN